MLSAVDTTSARKASPSLASSSFCGRRTDPKGDDVPLPPRLRLGFCEGDGLGVPEDAPYGRKLSWLVCLEPAKEPSSEDDRPCEVLPAPAPRENPAPVPGDHENGLLCTLETGVDGIWEFASDSKCLNGEPNDASSSPSGHPPGTSGSISFGESEARIDSIEESRLANDAGLRKADSRFAERGGGGGGGVRRGLLGVDDVALSAEVVFVAALSPRLSARVVDESVGD